MCRGCFRQGGPEEHLLSDSVGFHCFLLIGSHPPEGRASLSPLKPSSQLCLARDVGAGHVWLTSGPTPSDRPALVSQAHILAVRICLDTTFSLDAGSGRPPGLPCSELFPAGGGGHELGLSTWARSHHSCPSFAGLRKLPPSRVSFLDCKMGCSRSGRVM